MSMIRPATADDLPLLTAWEGDRDTAAWLGETGLAWHEHSLADPDQDHVVAEHDGAVTGFAVLAGLNGGDGVIELRRMVVDPGRRGPGQGRALLRAALARAYEHHGAGRVWLDVRAANRRAQALYESEGFAVTGAVTAEDLIIMSHRR
ncbi:GNAT family N-acetyltransferase [Nonomuraea sp. NBC_00507]|uniref:GNAT family N-acetyltransferase n=1 Tax=Nonomuraea sp. NBC_00507 TaxID=2976002 RepID=UPI002E1931D6